MRHPDSLSGGLSRRAWITTTSGVIAAGLVKTRFDAVDLLAQSPPPNDPTKVLGPPVSELGTRAPGENPPEDPPVHGALVLLPDPHRGAPRDHHPLGPPLRAGITQGSLPSIRTGTSS